MYKEYQQKDTYTTNTTKQTTLTDKYVAFLNKEKPCEIQWITVVNCNSDIITLMSHPRSFSLDFWRVLSIPVTVTIHGYSVRSLD